MNRLINNWIGWWKRSLRRVVNCSNLPHPSPPLAKAREHNQASPLYKGELRGGFQEKLRLIKQLLPALLIIAITLSCSAATEHGKILTFKTPPTSCRVVQHAMGKTCVPKQPKRVLTIGPLVLGDALALGVKPIGSASQFGAEQEEITDHYLSTQTYLGNKVEGIKHIGRIGTPNLERIILLKPDLILAWGTPNTIYPLLNRIAPTVMVPWSGAVVPWKASLNSVAEALGKMDALQEAWRVYFEKIEKLKASLGNNYQGKTISVCATNGENVIHIYTKNSFAGSILDDLGFARPASQSITTASGIIYRISHEKLDDLDSDIIFFAVYDNESMKTIENLQKKPLWQSLKAVQQGQVYLVSMDIWGGSNLLAANIVLDDLEKYLVNTP
jgi:iron complex transport system substrate-binding protein